MSSKQSRTSQSSASSAPDGSPSAILTATWNQRLNLMQFAMDRGVFTEDIETFLVDSRHTLWVTEPSLSSTGTYAAQIRVTGIINAGDVFPQGWGGEHSLHYPLGMGREYSTCVLIESLREP